MTNTMIDNRVRKLKALEAQQKELEAEAAKIKKELQTELETLELDEISTSNFTVRWKEVVSNRLDSKLLKVELPEIYARFSKSTTTKRFTIA